MSRLIAVLFAAVAFLCFDQAGGFSCPSNCCDTLVPPQPEQGTVQSDVEDLTRREFYPDGTLKAEWQVVRSGDGKEKREGKYRAWWENGSRQREGLYASDLEEGTHYFWYANGLPAAVRGFHLGKATGKEFVWRESGALFGVIEHKDGQWHGTVKHFYENGRPYSWCNCVEGKFNGPSLEWYQNGQLAKIVSYANGALSGPTTHWYENGQLSSIDFFTNDIRTGSSQKWTDKGICVEEGQYIEGKKHGRWVARDPQSGKVITDVNYDNGVVSPK